MAGGSMMYIDAVCKGIDEMPTIDEEVRLSVKEMFERDGIEALRMLLKRLDPGVIYHGGFEECQTDHARFGSLPDDWKALFFFFRPGA